MTLIENIGPDNDLIRFTKDGNSEKLVLFHNNEYKDIIIFKGSGDSELIQNKAQLEDLLNSFRINQSLLSNSDNGVFRVLRTPKGINPKIYYIRLDKLINGQSVDINFQNITTPFPQADIDDILDLLNSFYDTDPTNEDYAKYLEYFKKIDKASGFLVKTSDSSVPYDWMYVLPESGTDPVPFEPNTNQSDYWLRAYFSEDLDNHSIDLSGKKYGVESDFDCNSFESFEPIPKNALVELELEDKRVVYLDLYDGVDIDNGIVVKDMNISSQRVIKHIRIYYEINKSS